jgi:hypothetical protein
MTSSISDRTKWVTYAAFVAIGCFVAILAPPGSIPQTLAIGSLASFLVVLVAECAVKMHVLRLYLATKLWYRNSIIRVSIAYLIRIKLQDRYLLVFDDGFQQFQPIGGVFKRFENAPTLFEKLGVHDDDKLPIDDETRNDLRVGVPGKNLVEFLNWYYSGENREIGPWREFYCEMVETHLVPIVSFRFLVFRWVRRCAVGIQFSEYFQCNEYKLAEIYEPSLTEEQKQALCKAVDESPNRLRLATNAQIRARGVSMDHPAASISETAEWLLD